MCMYCLCARPAGRGLTGLTVSMYSPFAGLRDERCEDMVADDGEDEEVVVAEVERRSIAIPSLVPCS